MKNFFDNFRYDHPRLFRWIIWTFSIFMFLVIFLSLPPSPLLRAVGVTALQRKVSSLYYGVFWQVRASLHTSAVGGPIKTVYGNITGLDTTGRLVISIPDGNRFVQFSVGIADTKLTDLYGAAVLLGGLRMEDATFDVYENNQVVIWIRRTPLNVKLIEAGLAVPDPNPPTNIVDKAFSAHYWRIFNGNDHD